MPVSHKNMQPPQPAQLVCAKCGSNQFHEGEFRQYRQLYSATPGGDLSPVTEDPVRARICLCGEPVQSVKRMSDTKQSYTSFQRSLEAARQYRESTSPEAILTRIEVPFASKPQHDALAKRVANVEKILKEPPRPLPPQKSKP
jgi:hypothetical protein